jgi:PKD repeat protein
MRGHKIRKREKEGKMKRKTIYSDSLIRRLVVITAIFLFVAIAVSPVMAAPLPAPRHIFINVANDAGVKYNIDGPAYGGPSNTYYIKADGGGLNELHITNDIAVTGGQVTSTNAQSGVFYISNTGGRGFDNDIILLLAVNGTIPDDFSVHFRSSGYNWTPAAPGAYQPGLPTDYQLVNGAVDETFTKSDFIYGPQTWKPGAGDLVTPSLPLYAGQNINDNSNQFQLVFIDLKVGNLEPGKFSGITFSNNGDAKIEYSFHNLTTFATFNGYGWCPASFQGQGISWTNAMSPVTGGGGGGSSVGSGYEVTGVPYTPAVIRLPGYANAPTDPDHDGLYEDLSGNGATTYTDVLLFFKNLEWIQVNEPVSAFDFSGNGAVTYTDIRLLFKEVP